MIRYYVTREVFHFPACYIATGGLTTCETWIKRVLPVKIRPRERRVCSDNWNPVR